MFVSFPVAALDYDSVSRHAILYDTASDTGAKLAILRAGTPVELLVREGKWVKVRDPSGGAPFAWIETAALAHKRTVIVTTEQATVRREANDNAPAVFTASRDVVLDFIESTMDGWVKVRHADGASGYVRTREIWGI
jgi:SH3-like domain-containing protein